MTLAPFLKKQLSDVVSVYQALFKKTFGITVLLSFVFLLIIAAIHISTGPEAEPAGKMSVLNYLWYRYSTANAYNLVDMSKSVLLFIICFFSIALTRKVRSDKDAPEIQIGSFFNEIKPADLGFLFGALAACLVIDYLLYQLDSYAVANIRNYALIQWVHLMVHFLRIFLPLLLFSFAGRLALTNGKLGLRVKECLFLLISLWIFNELAYEFSLFVRSHILLLILAPFSEDKYFFVESILSIPLIAGLFLGYHSVMTNSVEIIQNEKREIAAE
ncbi:MAG TPA: hypothetical protein VIM79_24400 [Niastella sp.]